MTDFNAHGSLIACRRPFRTGDYQMADGIDLTGLKQFKFGDSADMADRLLALVTAGSKTATCWAACDIGTSVVDSCAVIHDGAERPCVVIETTELRFVRFRGVDAAFAHDEGGCDCSLACWRTAYRRYFERNNGCVDDIDLWCEHFTLFGRLRCLPTLTRD